MYNYLLQVEKNLSPYPDEIPVWDKVCVWMLRNVFGVRYWRELAYKQAKEMREYRKYFRNKA